MYVVTGAMGLVTEELGIWFPEETEIFHHSMADWPWSPTNWGSYSCGRAISHSMKMTIHLLVQNVKLISIPPNFIMA
jgi:hypothetical protein